MPSFAYRLRICVFTVAGEMTNALGVVLVNMGSAQ